MTLPKNDAASPLTRFCLELEEDRRTAAGRTRTSAEFREAYFSYGDGKVEDRVFECLPGEVRGPILAAWGIRGPKMAVRDTDEKVRSVVQDALVAGDLDDESFEAGLSPHTIVAFCDLPAWWRFWRTGPLHKHAIERALATGYALGLFDAVWLFDRLEAPPTGSAKAARGTDVLVEGLTKAELGGWIRAVHASGDGSAKGLVAALGWRLLVLRTNDDVLLAVVDAFAAHAGLARGEVQRRTSVASAPPARTSAAPPPLPKAPPVASVAPSPPAAPAAAPASPPPAPAAKHSSPPPPPQKAARPKDDQLSNVLANIDAALEGSAGLLAPAPAPAPAVGDLIELDIDPVGVVLDPVTDDEPTEFFLTKRATAAPPASQRAKPKGA